MRAGSGAAPGSAGIFRSDQPCRIAFIVGPAVGRLDNIGSSAEGLVFVCTDLCEVNRNARFRMGADKDADITESVKPLKRPRGDQSGSAVSPPEARCDEYDDVVIASDRGQREEVSVL